MNWNEKAAHQVKGWTQIQKIGIRQALELINEDEHQNPITNAIMKETRVKTLISYLNKTDEEER